MRPVIITANWKMNTTPADAGPLAADIAKATDVANVTRIICPPYTNIIADIADGFTADPRPGRWGITVTEPMQVRSAGLAADPPAFAGLTAVDGGDNASALILRMV